MLIGNTSRESLQGWSGRQDATAGLSETGQSPKREVMWIGLGGGGLPSQRTTHPPRRGPAEEHRPSGTDPARTPPRPGPPAAPALLSPQSSGWMKPSLNDMASGAGGKSCLCCVCSCVPTDYVLGTQYRLSKHQPDKDKGDVPVNSLLVRVVRLQRESSFTQ